MSTYRFHSKFTTGLSLPDFDEATVKNEPMFFNATPAFCWAKGGPVTKAFIHALADQGDWPDVVDTRVHMLMPGWFPAIPGWHHDDVPRSRQDGGTVPFSQHGQPDYDAPAYQSRHCLALIWGITITKQERDLEMHGRLKTVYVNVYPRSLLDEVASHLGLFNRKEKA